jgi:exodeoxyribonuclease-3
MRIINFCADGIRAADQKGFFEWLANQDADVICIQDLRCQEYQLTKDIFFPQGYFPYFFDHQDGINGVAIYTRKLPKAIMTGLGFNEFDQEARYIQADFDDLSIGSILLPYAADGDHSAIKRKLHFQSLLQQHLEKIVHKRREFIFAGNWQMAHQIRDVAQPVSDATPGFLLAERRWLDDVTHQLGYCDAFREVNHDDDEFTWWPEDGSNNAWRSDFQLVSRGMAKHIEYGFCYKNQSFSSHAPLVMDYDFPFEADDFY